MDWKKLFEILEQDEWDRESLPHYGLIPDWYLRYTDLRDFLIHEYKREKAGGTDVESGEGRTSDATEGEERA